jgi:hypothetical protein
MKAVLLTLVATSFVSGAVAVSAQERPWNPGPSLGNAACGQWSAVRKGQAPDSSASSLEAPERAAFLFEAVTTSWTQGFLSAAQLLLSLGARDSRPIFTLPEPVVLRAWLDKYCAEKPLDKISIAMLALVAELRGHTQK